LQRRKRRRKNKKWNKKVCEKNSRKKTPSQQKAFLSVIPVKKLTLFFAFCRIEKVFEGKKNNFAAK